MDIPMEKIIPIDARDMKSVTDELRGCASAKRREADELQRKANELLAMARGYEASADTLEMRVTRLAKVCLDKANEQSPAS